MQAAFPYRIREQQLWLSPERCFFWEEKKSLVVSDLHFGKTGHFRKSGIAVPPGVYKEDLQRLVTQIQYFQPETLIVVGDFFHSRLNRELDLFRKWREDLPDLCIHLIKGNHDILEEDWYEVTKIKVNAECLTIDEICFIHDIHSPSRPALTGAYFFSGHIHPGIRISGAGKQSLCFPCFHFGDQFAVIPAFSRFTGLAIVQPAKDEHIFAIVNQSIVQLQ